MKKCLTILGAFASILLVISTVTAVPQVHSEPTMKVVDNIERVRIFLEEESETCTEDLTKTSMNAQPKGLIDTIIALIRLIIKLLNSIIQLILNIMILGNLILSLIDIITTLIDVLTQFIEWLQDLFNPESFTIIK